MKKSIRPDYDGIEKKGVDPWLWWESTGKFQYLKKAKSITKHEVAKKIGDYIRTEHQIPDAKYVAALEAYEDMKWKYSSRKLRENVDKFRDSYGKWWQSSFNALKHTWSGVLDTFSGDISGMATNFSKLPDDVKQYWDGLVENTQSIGGVLTAGHDFDPNDPEKGGKPKDEGIPKQKMREIQSALKTMTNEKAGDTNMAKQNYVRNKVERISKSKNQPLRVGNHPEWYGRYPELLPNNLNYAVRKEYSKFNMAIGASVWCSLVVPQKEGKVSQAYKDAIRAIYIKMRGSNSGAFNYDDEDIAAYIESCRFIYAMFYRLHRDIRLVNNLDPYIAKTPYPALALAGYRGLIADDLINNRANYLIRLNHLSHKISITFPLPPDMSVFDRDRYIATSVLEEGKGPKSALFMYSVLTGLTPSGTDTELTEQTFFNANFSQHLNDLETLINNTYAYTNPTYGGQTFVKIAGDMIKAYGDAAFKTLPLITESDKCEVLRDEYLLNQLQNNNTIAMMDNVATNQDDNVYDLVYDCDIDTDLVGTGTITLAGNRIPGSNSNPQALIINRNSGNISNLESLSLTRGNYLFEAPTSITVGTTVSTVRVTDTGTDVIRGLQYWYYDSNNNFASEDFHGSASNVYDPVKAELWAQVDYSPLYPAIPATNTLRYLLDLDTYAFCSPDQFRVMNDAAVMSEYKTVGITAQANFRTVRR